MNCCDQFGNCNQGRDCPVRVARVGQKMHGPEPIRGAGWRHWLKRLGYWLLTGILGVLWLAFFLACIYLYAN
jgi:hypothetical protein